METNKLIPGDETLTDVFEKKEKYFKGIFSLDGSTTFYEWEIKREELDEWGKKFREILVGSFKKEKYCYLAINNLLKKVNFLELYQQLLNEQISENEFENEIKTNPNLYTIDVSILENPQDIIYIHEIIDKLEVDVKEYSINEIGEIFSIAPDSFKSSLTYYSV